ncbi:CDC42 small effector protein 2-like [Ptychodera flava]|uniref:CDC42 small effector protein 2-like n=1 Tax=Ptychodera flava TaxID=63121 RepID=UPI003969CC3B
MGNSKMGDTTWLCFTCCITQQPQQKRRRIDITMIGEPTNFVHTGHIGSGDMASGGGQVGVIQTQMKSKGGYNNVSPVHVDIAVGDVQKEES